MKARSPIEYAGVVIPACDEQATITRCVHSVLQALSDCLDLRYYWVVVVADCCSDATAELAQAALGVDGEVLLSNSRSPGTARRDGAEAALRHFTGIDPQRIWLGSTDADSHVPRDWISTHVQLAGEGASAVAGIVNVDSFGNSDDEFRKRFAATYPIHADGTHPHVHAANLGLRADAYLDAGGWSDLPVGEDHCLWQRLKSRGWKTRSASSSVVTTSGRFVGRATGGFADTLRARLLPAGAGVC